MVESMYSRPPSTMGLDMVALEEQFYSSLEESDNLVDYFCIVGLDQQKVQ